MEFDWLARDADGHVALFSTAGGSYVPDAVRERADLQAAAIDAVLALPASTTARFAPSLGEGYVNTWALVAERGLFAYDGDFNEGPYELVAAPENPVRVDELPFLTDLLLHATYPNLRFAGLTTITADLLRSDSESDDV